MVADIIEIGQRLIAVRERIGGEFVEWLDHEFGWSERQAYKIMDVAQSFATVANDLATIELSAIYLLSAPSTPEPVREQAVARAAEGEHITRAADDELADLATDIKAHGLLHPIVIDAEGRLVDGRNRLRASQLAGVKPQFTHLAEHDDAKALIVSANL